MCLHDYFCSHKKTTHPQASQALSGLGGIGKTQVAIEYVYRYCSEYRFIFWVRGDTREKMLSDFASLATTLNLKVQHEQDQQLLIEAVRSSLRKHSHWLLIIDNIEDLRNAQSILPTSARGHILLTTRTQTTGNIAKHVELEKMTLDEGALFLLRRIKILAQDDSLLEVSTVDLQSAKAIGDVLDGLPLALIKLARILKNLDVTSPTTSISINQGIRNYCASEVALILVILHLSQKHFLMLLRRLRKSALQQSNCYASAHFYIKKQFQKSSSSTELRN